MDNKVESNLKIIPNKNTAIRHSNIAIRIARTISIISRNFIYTT